MLHGDQQYVMSHIELNVSYVTWSYILYHGLWGVRKIVMSYKEC
jgi:hypothetical protein